MPVQHDPQRRPLWPTFERAAKELAAETTQLNFERMRDAFAALPTEEVADLLRDREAGRPKSAHLDLVEAAEGFIVEWTANKAATPETLDRLRQTANVMTKH
jgi:hypothetical protein